MGFLTSTQKLDVTPYSGALDSAMASRVWTFSNPTKTKSGLTGSQSIQLLVLSWGQMNLILRVKGF